MKEFLSTYIELLQNNHDMVGKVHSEFKRQFMEMTVDKLLEQFVLSKYTGLEKPGKRMLCEGRSTKRQIAMKHRTIERKILMIAPFALHQFLAELKVFFVF